VAPTTLTPVTLLCAWRLSSMCDGWVRSTIRHWNTTRHKFRAQRSFFLDFVNFAVIVNLWFE